MAAPELQNAAATGCTAAARAGWSVLACSGTAVDAVIAAVIELENDPAFNAGLGSVLTSAGTVETDASIMDGATLAAGACAAVGGVRNPITLARTIMDEPTTVLLVGSGALDFARERGVTMCPAEALITERQRLRWQHHAHESGPGGTVGAVAVDVNGHVAAATSTGGLFYKRPGRVGDSGVIGAGTYADDFLGAASATGAGEAIMRVTLAKAVVDLLQDGRDPMVAAQATIRLLAQRTGAVAGVIVVDPMGRIGYACNSPCMPVAYRHGQLDEVKVVC